MLKQKLMLGLGPLVLLLIVLTCASILLIESMLSHYDEVNASTGERLDQVGEFEDHLGTVEREFLLASAPREIDRNKVSKALERMQTITADFEAEAASDARHPETRKALAVVAQRIPVFQNVASASIADLDLTAFEEHRLNLLGIGEPLEHAVMDLARATFVEGSEAQMTATQNFRWKLLATSVVVILLINIAVLMLLRTAGVIVRPVERLVEATRQIGEEHFDERLELDQHDEFEELTNAYNRMAAQLEQNEARKIEALKQVALTLNHELNNALEIIELQLQLAARRPDKQALDEKAIREIRASLKRMATTVESLKHVRRIVLTEYGQGQKMLDLSRSVLPDDVEPSDSDSDESTPHPVVQTSSSSLTATPKIA